MHPSSNAPEPRLFNRPADRPDPLTVSKPPAQLPPPNRSAGVQVDDAEDPERWDGLS